MPLEGTSVGPRRPAVGSLFTAVVAAACVLLIGGESQGQTNLVANGSFEVGPTLPANCNVALNAGSNSVAGWTVTRGQIDFYGSCIAVIASGVRAIDLSGSPGIGGIKQTITTVPGQTYLVRFALSGNPSPDTFSIKRMRVRAGTLESPDFSFDVTGYTSFNAPWVETTWSFTAQQTLTELEFFMTSASQCQCCAGVPCAGPAIDNVRVLCLDTLAQPVPTAMCRGGATTFSLTTGGTGPFTYQWQWQPAGPNTAWAALANGTNANNQATPTFNVSGATTPTMNISSISGLGGNFRCIVTNACGSITSNEATLTIIQPCGLADIASDSLQTERCANGSIGPEDLDAFIAGFIADNAAIADVASDSLDTTYNPNGAVGPEDLDAFIASFIAGC